MKKPATPIMTTTKAAAPKEPKAPELVVLKNTRRQVAVFNLPHAEFCEDGACACTSTIRRRAELLPDGSTGVRETSVRINGSLTILARSSSGPISKRVMNVRDVSAAVARGDLQVAVVTLSD